MNRLSTSLGKIQLSNPITVASGTFGIEYLNLMNINELGAYVTKTITLNPKEGNPPPRLYETECGLLNSIGLQNIGLEVFLSEQLPVLKEVLSIPIIVSFSGSSVDEFVYMLKIMERYDGISGYEINVSCPNVEQEGIAFGVNPEVVYSLTAKLASLTDRELIIKLTPNVTDISSIAKAAEDGGATAFALINTLYGMAIDPLTGKSRISRGICGYSGPGIKPVALANVYKVAQTVKLPIIGMGGICSWQDSLEFFYAGASAIAIGTYTFVQPTTAIDIKNELAQYLEKKEITITDLIGKVSF